MSELAPVNQTSASNRIDDSTFGDFDEEGLIQIEMQSAGIDQQDLKIQKDAIQKKNADLQEKEHLLAILEGAAPSDASKDTADTTVTMTKDDWYALAKTDAGKDMHGTSGTWDPREHGLVTVDFDAGDLTKAVSALKDDIQAESQDSQLDMINLQSRLNSYNQRIESITNMVQKKADTADKIVGNL